jgi:integrase
VTATVGEIVTNKTNRFQSGQLRDRSLDDFKVRSNKFVETHGNALIKEIDASAIKTWVQSLKLTARSNKNYLSVLSEIFRYATQKKYIAHNPFSDFTDHDLKELRGNDGDKGEPNILTIKQAEKLLTTALAHPELDLLAPVVLGLFCGIRTQELMKLNWSHLNINAQKPEQSFVTIPKGIAKKRRIRNVTIPANAIIWLALCPKKSGQITRNQYSTDYRKRFLKLQRLAGFGKVVDKVWRSTWEENGMRHSFGTYHFALHGNSIETARQLGHAASDHVLFDHYRALAAKEQGEEYFNLLPPKSDSVIVEFPKVAP